MKLNVLLDSKPIVFLCSVQVDDNMVNRRVASSMLSRYGATVTTANGGVEAVTAIKNQREGEEFDMILMDIQMPEVFLTFMFHFGTIPVTMY